MGKKFESRQDKAEEDHGENNQDNDEDLLQEDLNFITEGM